MNSRCKEAFSEATPKICLIQIHPDIVTGCHMHFWRLLPMRLDLHDRTTSIHGHFPSHVLPSWVACSPAASNLYLFPRIKILFTLRPSGPFFDTHTLWVIPLFLNIKAHLCFLLLVHLLSVYFLSENYQNFRGKFWTFLWLKKTLLPPGFFLVTFQKEERWWDQIRGISYILQTEHRMSLNYFIFFQWIL